MASGPAITPGSSPRRTGDSRLCGEFAVPHPPIVPLDGRDRDLPGRGCAGSRRRPRAAATLLATLERQGYVAAIGAIALPNDASVALHEKLGFIYAGTYRGVGFKLGEWLDVGLWEKELAPRSAEPREPLPYA